MKIKHLPVLEQDNSTSAEIRDCIENLAMNYEATNGSYIYCNQKYNRGIWKNSYPALYKFLEDNNISECLIHIWW